jgi:hypothetical protein
MFIHWKIERSYYIHSNIPGGNILSNFFPTEKKKMMLPIWQIYRKRENPLQRILFLSRRIPDRQTS